MNIEQVLDYFHEIALNNCHVITKNKVTQVKSTSCCCCFAPIYSKQLSMSACFCVCVCVCVCI